jgi:CheY-like chemotaxis protein
MPKEKILVVDDEEDILELLRFNLSREGIRSLDNRSVIDPAFPLSHVLASTQASQKPSS